MKAQRLTTFAAALLFLIATITTSAQQGAEKATADTEYQAAAVLWMQKSAEYRALALQAFNIARLRLDRDFEKSSLRMLPKPERNRPRAIIVDIDETVLDNSPAQAFGVKNSTAFSLPGWYAWGDMRKARPIPGSVEFLNYAVSRGVKIYFISNRDEVQKQATMDNLKSAGFRDITEENVLLRQKDEKGSNISTKTPRRDYVSARYRVVMLLGDNLDDFSDVFERKSISDRFLETEKFRDQWGKTWIVLPNAMYGSWESAIYEYKNLSDAEKAQKRREALELPETTVVP